MRFKQLWAIATDRLNILLLDKDTTEIRKVFLYLEGCLHQNVQLRTRDLEVVPEDDVCIVHCVILMRVSGVIPQGLMTRHHQFSHCVKVSLHEGLSCRIGSDDKRVLGN